MRFYNPEDLSKPLSLEELFPLKDPFDPKLAKEAVEMGFLPSITTILSTIRHSYLERYKFKLGLEAYQQTGNIQLAWKMSQSGGTSAASFGTKVHNEIHRWLTGLPPEDQEAVKYAEPGMLYLEKEIKNLIYTEKTLCSLRERTAGTLDLLYENKKGQMVLSDMKVVKFRRSYPLEPSINYRAQLCAYKKILSETNILVDRTENIFLASPFGDMPTPSIIPVCYEKDYFYVFKSARTVWEAEIGIGIETFNLNGAMTPTELTSEKTKPILPNP